MKLLLGWKLTPQQRRLRPHAFVAFGGFILATALYIVALLPFWQVWAAASVIVGVVLLYGLSTLSTVPATMTHIVFCAVLLAVDAGALLTIGAIGNVSVLLSATVMLAVDSYVAWIVAAMSSPRLPDDLPSWDARDIARSWMAAGRTLGIAVVAAVLTLTLTFLPETRVWTFGAITLGFLIFVLTTRAGQASAGSSAQAPHPESPPPPLQ